MDNELQRMINGLWDEYLKMCDVCASMSMQKDYISPSDIDDIIFELDVMEEVIGDLANFNYGDEDLDEELNATIAMVTECIDNIEGILFNQ